MNNPQHHNSTSRWQMLESSRSKLSKRNLKLSFQNYSTTIKKTNRKIIRLYLCWIRINIPKILIRLKRWKSKMNHKQLIKTKNRRHRKVRRKIKMIQFLLRLKIRIKKQKHKWNNLLKSLKLHQNQFQVKNQQMITITKPIKKRQ